VTTAIAVGTVQDMGKLDLASPYDVLTELRSVLTLAEIAEMTGLRRETLSRARSDVRFQRRTAKAIDDLYLVVDALRPLLNDDVTHLAAVLRRPQRTLGRRSIAELLREDQVETVLRSLVPSEPTDEEQLEKFRLEPKSEAELQASEAEPSSHPPHNPTWVDPAAFLKDDPDLASRLPAIEATIRDRFGADVRIEHQVIHEPFNPDVEDGFYLRIHSELSFDEEADRLERMLGDERDLLDPVMRRLTIGFLG
jgi:transcriptional regulator with XRE-family HTH domain